MCEFGTYGRFAVHLWLRTFACSEFQCSWCWRLAIWAIWSCSQGPRPSCRRLPCYLLWQDLSPTRTEARPSADPPLRHDCPRGATFRRRLSAAVLSLNCSSDWRYAKYWHCAGAHDRWNFTRTPERKFFPTSPIFWDFLLGFVGVSCQNYSVLNQVNFCCWVWLWANLKHCLGALFNVLIIMRLLIFGVVVWLQWIKWFDGARSPDGTSETMHHFNSQGVGGFRGTLAPPEHTSAHCQKHTQN